MVAGVLRIGIDIRTSIHPIAQTIACDFSILLDQLWWFPKD